MPPPDWTTKDYLTTALAAWGAALSSFLAARQIRRDRPAVKVIVGFTRAEPAEESEEEFNYRDYWEVRVVNIRVRPIEITSMTLHMADRRVVRAFVMIPAALKHERSAELPITLTDHQTAKFFYDAQVVDSVGGLRSVSATDSLDREYVGRARRRTPRAVWDRFRINRRRRKQGLPRLKTQ